MKKIADLKPEIEKAIAKAQDSIGQATVEHIKETINTQGGPRNHSAPGGFPYRIKGDLHDAGSYDVDNDGVLEIQWGDKALWLEYGTQTMAARPFMQPGKQWLQKNFGKLFASAWKKSFGAK